MVKHASTSASPVKGRRVRPGRNSDLAMIHIAAEKLGLIQHGDDSAYRDMLFSIARVRSAAKLDSGGREAVLKHLEACGWNKPKPASTGTRYQKGSPAALIRWLWSELHREGRVEHNTDQAMRRYIAQHAGLDVGGVDEIAPQHLDRHQLNQVIEQLKRWLKRKDGATA